MTSGGFSRGPVGLLVSVRSPAEAIEALRGGADVIDVKEPLHGPLGPADPLTIDAIVRRVAGCVPITVAWGELSDAAFGDATAPGTIPEGVSLFKLGLAGCRDVSNWQRYWRETIRRCSLGATGARPVAVAYADWRAADAPDPEEVFALGTENNCPALLIDTWDKSAGTLLDYWPPARLGSFIYRVRSRGLAVVLAGSLSGAAIRVAASLDADLVAVRSAACDFGRNGVVSAERVRTVRDLLHSTDPAIQVADPDRPTLQVRLGAVFSHKHRNHND